MTDEHFYSIDCILFSLLQQRLGRLVQELSETAAK
jgi:hypothetical protein